MWFHQPLKCLKWWATPVSQATKFSCCLAVALKKPSHRHYPLPWYTTHKTIGLLCWQGFCNNRQYYRKSLCRTEPQSHILPVPEMGAGPAKTHTAFLKTSKGRSLSSCLFACGWCVGTPISSVICCALLIFSLCKSLCLYPIMAGLRWPSFAVFPSGEPLAWQMPNL